jgi:hypothetical protein
MLGSLRFLASDITRVALHVDRGWTTVILYLESTIDRTESYLCAAFDNPSKVYYWPAGAADKQ